MLSLGEAYPRIVTARSYSMRTRLDFLSDLNTVILSGVGPQSGAVTFDKTAQFRRQTGFDVVDDNRYEQMGIRLTPQKAGDPLSPYGTIVRPVQTLWTPLNGPVDVPLGVYRLSDGNPNGDGTISCTGYDFSRVIARNLFTAPFVIPAGTNYADAIVSVVSDRLGGLYSAGSIATTTETTPLLTLDAGADEDPWSQVTKMADAIGMDAYFDRAGAFCLQQPADPSTDAVVWSYDDGGGLLLEAKREMSDDPGYNGVVMVSESTLLNTPIRSELWDMNPDSPTYSQGDYGRVPSFQSSPYIGSQAQGDAAAQKWLLDNLGGTEKVSFEAMPNPAHEPGDMISMGYDRDGIDGLFVMDTFTIGFRSTDTLQVTTRTRRAITGDQVTETT